VTDRPCLLCSTAPAKPASWFCCPSHGRTYARFHHQILNLRERGELDAEQAVALLAWPPATLRQALLGPAELEFVVEEGGQLVLGVEA
jgi:hypothetical protein